jgi:hypothetical protein
MLASTHLFLAVPLTGVLTQTPPIQVTVISSSPIEIRFSPGARFRSASDREPRPLGAQGTR